MRITLILSGFALALATPVLARDVQTNEAAREAVSASNDCKGLRDLAIRAETCWLLIDAQPQQSREDLVAKRAFASFYLHVKDHHNQKVGCNPPLNGIGKNGTKIPDRENADPRLN